MHPWCLYERAIECKSAIRKGPVHLAQQAIRPPACDFQVKPAVSLTKGLKILILGSYTIHRSYQRHTDNGPERFNKPSRSYLLITMNKCFTFIHRRNLQALGIVWICRVLKSTLKQSLCLGPQSCMHIKGKGTLVLRFQEMLSSEMPPP